MQFTLKHLLLIFPAFAVSLIIIAFSHAGVRGNHPRSFNTVNDIKEIHMAIEFIPEYEPGIDFPVNKINQWLAGNLPANHPVSLRYSEFLEYFRVDPWGNPYRCIDTIDKAEGWSRPIGIYSMGEDGVTSTQGNDPDDINSWDKTSYDWYSRRDTYRSRRDFVLEGLMYTPFGFIGLLLCLKCVRLVRSATRASQTNGSHNIRE